MPTFCRHNRFADRCPICREDKKSATRPRAGSERGAAARAPRTSSGSRSRAARGEVRIRRLERATEDGYGHRLVPGLRASADAMRLAREIAFSCARLDELETAPHGLYGDVARAGDREHATWLAFVIAYAGTLEDGGDPFRSIRESGLAATTGPDDPGVEPALHELIAGVRGSHDPGAPLRTLEAYRTWVGRTGAAAAALEGDSRWTAQRRFERAYERVALAGLRRSSRYDLLVTLGRLGVYALEPACLEFGGDDSVTVAAKRVFGIGDPITLERRAAALAGEAAVPPGALDLALHNWAGPDIVRGGASAALEADETVAARVGSALGV